MKRVHYAILLGEILSYLLIITFIFADHTFDLTSIFREPAVNGNSTGSVAGIAACLVGIVGAINVWLTYYYMQKANTIKDWVVVCAWTHRIKQGNRWFSLEEFLSDQMGCQISHGLSEEGYNNISTEIDSKWRNLRIDQLTTDGDIMAGSATPPRPIAPDAPPAPAAPAS